MQMVRAVVACLQVAKADHCCQVPHPSNAWPPPCDPGVTVLPLAGVQTPHSSSSSEFYFKSSVHHTHMATHLSMHVYLCVHTHIHITFTAEQQAACRSHVER